MTSTAAFVRNKVCLCFDRSRSMTFDTTGNDESWPTSASGYPYGVPSSVGGSQDREANTTISDGSTPPAITAAGTTCPSRPTPSWTTR